MRVLFTGQLFDGSSALARAQALRAIGHDVEPIESFPSESGLTRVARTLRRRRGAAPQHPVNRALVNAARRTPPDVFWVDKGLHVAMDTLERLRDLQPNLLAVHYMLDDWSVRSNVSYDLRRSIPHYDLVVTTKSHNVQTLKSLGANRVVMSWQGYDSRVHRPFAQAELDSTLVGRAVFVGGFETDRGRTISALARAGLPVTVISPHQQWKAVVADCPAAEWRDAHPVALEYARVLASADVSLGFLRKIASDRHTQRSVEIPACGGVMLAERTEEHLALFTEGVEAEFFSSDEECVDKTADLLRSASRRIALRRFGRARCERDRYSWEGRVSEILAHVPRVAADNIPCAE